MHQLFLHLLLIFVASSALAKPVSFANKQVTVQLNWYHQFEFAAFYAAINQGYYREIDLDVKLRQGGPGIDSVAEVVSNRAEFGIANASIILAREQGMPVIALAAIMQHSAVALLAQRSHGIENIADLANKTIGCSAHDCGEIKAFLLGADLPEESLRLVADPPFPRAEDRLQQGIDATTIYTVNEGYFLQNNAHNFSLFTPRSVGIDLFGDLLISNDTVVRKHPQLVKLFRQATLKGLVYAMQHQSEIVNLILRDYNTQQKSADHLLYEAIHLQPLIRLDIVEPGYMSPARWEHVRNVYQTLGMLPTDYNSTAFIYELEPYIIPRWLLWTTSIVSILLLIFIINSLLLRKMNNKLQIEICERKNVETALQASQSAYKLLVENANSILSHELRTPLSVIKIHLNLLEHKMESENPWRQHLQLMRGGVQRLEDLFGETLHKLFSSDSLHSERKEIDLYNWLEICLTEFRSLSPDAVVVCELATGTKVNASEDMLQTAVLNMLGNAVKYSPTNSTIQLRLTRRDNMAHIEIYNQLSGGVITKNPNELFTKRVRGSENQSIEGTGVGLYLVRLIAQAHQGDVTADITEDNEFHIDFTLPLQEKHSLVDTELS